MVIDWDLKHVYIYMKFIGLSCDALYSGGDIKVSGH